MKNNYLLEGEVLAVQEEIKRIIKENNFEGQEKNKYDLEEVSLENVLEDLDTYSFLSPKKVVIAYNIDVVLDKENNYIPHLFKYLDNSNEDVLLILTSKKLNFQKKLAKDLKKKTEYKKLSIEPQSFLREQLKTYQVEQGVYTLLEEYSNGKITNLYNECCKLKLYCYDTKKITKNDVLEICIKKPKDSDTYVFDFIGAILSKNKKNALTIYNDLVQSNTEPLALISLINSQLRLIYQTAILRKRGYRKEEIAQELDVHPFRVTKAFEYLNYYSEEDIMNLVLTLREMDFKIKTSGVDANILIELFIANL